MVRAFIDTNVFIYGFEFPDSNSAKIIDLINTGELEAFTSQKVLDETFKYFKNYHTKKLADEFRHYLLEVCIIIQKSEIKKELRKYKGKIKDKDLQQLAAAKHLELKLISYDRDFEGFDEYMTPKKFMETLEKSSSKTEF